MPMSSICDIISVLSSISGNEQTHTYRVGAIFEAGADDGDEDDCQPK
jgi:hypothetical protein